MARKKLRVKTEKQEKSFVIATVTQLKRDNPDYLQLYRLVDEYLRTSFNKKQLKAEALKWAKRNNKKSVKIIQEMDDWRFIVFGKLCFILNHQGELPEEGENFISNKLKEFEDLVDVEKLTTTKNKKTNNLSVQDYLRIKAQTVVGERFEPVIDSIFHDADYKVDIKPLNVMHEEEISQGHARYILKMFVSDIEDLEAVLNGTADDQLIEGYSKATQSQLKTALKFYKDIHKAAEMIIQKSIANRKPRKKTKKVDFEKMVEKFKYLDQHSDLGLVSESPIKIIGAKEVWVYNTKNRMLGKYVALDSTGLGVKGTTIKNFSTDKSRQKILRAPEKQLKDFKDGGTRKFNNKFKEIKAVDAKVKTRINDDTIILKCFK